MLEPNINRRCAENEVDTWGDWYFKVLDEHEIVLLLQAQGKMTIRNSITERGKKLTMTHWHSQIMGHQIYAMCSDKGQKSL